MTRWTAGLTTLPDTWQALHLRKSSSKQDHLQQVEAGVTQNLPVSHLVMQMKN